MPVTRKSHVGARGCGRRRRSAAPSRRIDTSDHGTNGGRTPLAVAGLAALVALWCTATSAAVSVPTGKPAEVTVALPEARSGLLFLAPGGARIRDTLVLHEPVRALAAAGDLAVLATGADVITVDLAPENGPRHLARLPLDRTVTSLQIAGTRVYALDDEGLTVIDVSHPRQPRLVGHLKTAAAPLDLAVDGRRLYLLSEGGLSVWRRRDDALPAPAGSLKLQHAGGAMAAAHDVVYVATGPGGVLMIDAGDPAAMTVLGRYRITGSALDLAVVDGHVLVAAGQGGLAVLAVAGPGHLQWRGSFRRLGMAERIAVHGPRALVTDDRGRLLQVDLTDTARPELVAALPAVRPVGPFALAGATVLSAGGETMRVIDISAAPPRLGNQGLDFGEGVNLGGQRRVFIHGDIAYVADWFSGIHLYDISSPRRLRLLSSFHTAGSPKGIVVRKGLAYVADDDHGLQIIDVSDPRRPARVAQLRLPGLAYTPVLQGDLLYLAVHRGGFVVVDIHDPHRPELVGHYDTPGKAWSIRVRDDRAYVADGDSGLLVFDVSAPRAPRLVGRFDPGGDAEEVLLDGDRAYVAFFDRGVYVLDISDPASPRPLAHTATPGNARGLDRRGDRLYVADWLAGVQVLDIGDPANPGTLGGYDTDGAAWGVAVHDRHAFVMDWWGGIAVLDIASPERPVAITHYPERERIEQIAVAGKYGFLATGSAGLQVFDLQNPLNPTWVTGVDGVDARAVAIQGTMGYVLDGTRRIAVVDISNPFHTALIDRFEWPREIMRLCAAGDRLAIVDDRGAHLLDPFTRQATRIQTGRPVTDVHFGQGRLLAATAGDGLTVVAADTGANPGDTQVYPVDRPLTRVRAAGNHIYIHVAGEGIRILSHEASRDGGRLSEVARIPMTAVIDDMQIADNTLYFVTGRSRILAVDVADPERWRMRSVYRTLDTVTGLTVRDDTLYLAGGRTLTALETLPPVSIGLSDGNARLQLPATLVSGHYDIAVTQRDGTEQPYSLLRHNAVEVEPLHFGKPDISPQRLRELLERHRIRRP